MNVALCIAVFVGAYALQATYITVFYHRGLAHKGLRLKPWMHRFVATTGGWVTGIDPLGWVCMHRMHHAFSDTHKDPHSPLRWGLLGTAVGQLKSYKRTLVKLSRQDPEYTKHIKDLDLKVGWLNQRRLWTLPYISHGVIAVVLSAYSGIGLLGVAYWVGMMSHPVQGWAVNALAHSFGRRNFTTDDNSRNNHLVGWFVFGEGYQNNHHRFPDSAKLSYRWPEMDMGYWVSVMFETLGLLEIDQLKVLRGRPRRTAASLR